MVGVKEVIQVRLLSIDSQGILGQVIGTDAEEIHFFSQLVTNECRCGRFYHNSHFHRLIKSNSFMSQLVLHLSQ